MGDIADGAYFGKWVMKTAAGARSGARNAIQGSQDLPDEADLGILCQAPTPALKVLRGVGVPCDQVLTLHVPKLVQEALERPVKLLSRGYHQPCVCDTCRQGDD